VHAHGRPSFREVKNLMRDLVLPHFNAKLSRHVNPGIVLLGGSLGE